MKRIVTAYKLPAVKTSRKSLTEAFFCCGRIARRLARLELHIPFLPVFASHLHIDEMGELVGHDVFDRVVAVRVVACGHRYLVALPQPFAIPEPSGVEQDDWHGQEAQPVVQAHGVAVQLGVEPRERPRHRDADDDGMGHGLGIHGFQLFAGLVDQISPGPAEVQQQKHKKCVFRDKS